jgi:hypothetical protein
MGIFEMFEDVQDIVKSIQSDVDKILSVNLEYYAQEDIDNLLRETVQEYLLSYAQEAALQSVEYAYPPLLERLLENLSNPEHVEVQNGVVTKCFDETVAGDASDFYAGVEEGGGHTLTDMAPNIWKYGIYTPNSAWKGGKGPRVFKNLPSYEDVIAERLDAWGDKAPYWYLLENGNAGGGREFPTIRPTHFITNLRRAARKLQTIVTDIIYELTSSFADAQVQKILIEPGAGTTVAVARVNIPSIGLRLTKLKTSAGNTFYNLNGERSLTASEAMYRIKGLMGD